MKTGEQLELEANAATKALSGLMAQMMNDGVEQASLVEALACALGVMMAAAPRSMAERLDASILNKIQVQRAETWAAVDAAAAVH